MYAFTALDRCSDRIRLALHRLEKQDGEGVQTLESTARDIRRLLDVNRFGALAALHLFRRTSTAGELAVFHALTAMVLADALELPDEEQQLVVSAALAANLSLWEEWDALSAQAGPLTPEQQTLIKEHPERSQKMLAEAGVTDTRLLELVAQHHEEADGSGYPGGLQAKDIDDLVPLLRLAESYCAEITARRYRKAGNGKAFVSGAQAMRNRAKAFDATGNELEILLVKAIGVMPPGTWVRLRNGEVGLVHSFHGNTARPRVVSFGYPGAAFLNPLQRETTEAAYRIEAIIEDPPWRAKIHLSSLWPDAS